MREIDVLHMGRERVICSWAVDGLIVDPGPQSCEATLVAALDGEAPRALLLTHIHLDHAGATGALVRRWPDLQVYVHERGAPHLVDPSKLIASASRLYPDMDRRWGEIVPVPEENVHVISDGDEVLGFRVLYTPGHASHHVAFLHEGTGTAFPGDVLGVRLPGERYTLMPTPPPDIDLERWQDSITAVAALEPTALALPHFGRHEDVDTLVADARAALDELGDWSRELEEDEFLARFEEDLAARAGDAARAAYAQASPPPLQYLGLNRYWTKRRERQSSP